MITWRALSILAIFLTGCGQAQSLRQGHTTATAPPFQSVANIYPQAETVRLFVASDTVVERPEYRFERKWLNPEGGYLLTADLVARLRRAVRAEPPQAAYAACFIPHHFFRFYDGSGRQIGQLSVCFCCGGIRADPQLILPKGWGQGADLVAIAAIVRATGSSPTVNCDQPGEGPEEGHF